MLERKKMAKGGKNQLAKDYEGIIQTLNDRVAALEARVELIESLSQVRAQTIKVLQDHIGKLDGEINKLDERVLDQEQYQRRTSLRIHGVPVSKGKETNEDVVKIVENTHVLKVPFDRNKIFLAHRIGKKRTVNNATTQTVIVKYKDWDTRCALYRARPKRKKPLKGCIYTVQPAPTSPN